MAGDTNISDDAVRNATGHDWRHWMERMDALGALDMQDHAVRAAALAAAEPALSGWWVQMITVQHERDKGLREVGASAGGYQVSVSKTCPFAVDEAWRRLTTIPFLPGVAWVEGDVSQLGEEAVEVRRVAPEKLLRWWQFDRDGRSTVEVHLVAKGERTTMVVRHHGLPDAAARDNARPRWQNALALLLDDA